MSDEMKNQGSEAQLGALLEESETRPFIVSGDACHFIESGAVNVFCSHRRKDGVLGKRVFIAKFSEGDYLLPSPVFEREGESYLLIADALGRSLIRKLPGAAPQGGIPQEKLEAWVEGLSSAFIPGSVPSDCDAVTQEELKETGNALSLKAGAAFRPARGVLWASVKSGMLSICGNERNQPLVEGSMFPLSSRAWLKCQDASEVEAVPAPSFGPEDSGESSCLKEFHSAFFRALLMANMENERRSAESRKLLVDLEKKAMGAALTNLAVECGCLDRPDGARVNASTETMAMPHLAVLETIASHAGMKFNIPPSLPQDLSSEELIKHLLESSMIYYRRIKLAPGWSKDDCSYLVAFKKEGSVPVALINGKGRNVLHDPAAGCSKVLEAKDEELLEPFGYTVYPQLQMDKVRLLDIAAMALRHRRPELTTAIFVGFAGGIAALVPPYVTSSIFNSIIPHSDHFQLVQITVILVTAALVAALFNLLRAMLVLRIKTLADYHVQAAIVGRLLKLPTSFFKRYPSGELSSKVMGVESMMEVLTDNVEGALFALLFSLPSFGLMFFYSGKLAFVAFAFILVFMAVMSVVSYLNYLNDSHLVRLKVGRSGFVLQTLAGVAKIRHSMSENRAFIKWAGRFSLETHWIKKSMVNSNFISVFDSVYPALITCAFFYLVGATWKGALDLGDYLAFNSAFTSFMGALLEFAAIIPAVMSLLPSYQQMAPILLERPEMESGSKPVGVIDGKVELSHVSYRYAPDSPLVLRDVSITAEPGEFIAIVGPSGAGKSTLVRLLLGFEEPASGGVYFSGQDISSVNKRDLRKQIGAVLQFGGLTSGSIYENIAGASLISMDAAWEAAEMAGCDQDIEAMPMGMHTLVGNGTVSGGQKQRILIARALAKRPRVIIFDEATSAIDNVTQARISESLEKMNATRIVIAHRLSTIRHADKIYVLERGQVVESGSFDELIKQAGVFQRLAKRQVV